MNAPISPLRRAYGEMILPRGTVLYHTNMNKPFTYKAKKPMLFTTFHPNNWGAYGDYITQIILKKDVSLLFMVGALTSTGRILPLLNTLVGRKGANLNKEYDAHRDRYIGYLRAENYDGWFSTIEGKSTVEISLINVKGVYEYRNIGIYDDTNIYAPYPITNNIIRLRINGRYKPMIDAYMQNKYNGKHIFVFQRVLANAQIEYTPTTAEDIIWTT